MSPHVLLAMTVFVFASTNAFAQIETRITSINGKFNPRHSVEIKVHPGDTIQLSADEVNFDNTDGQTLPLNREVEGFIWSSDARSGDICDPQYDCEPSNFDANEYGVSFDVPYSMGKSILITVQNRSNSSQYDQIRLVNKRHVENYAAPEQVYSDPADYRESNFDYDRALAGHGRWVYIEGKRCFVPTRFQADWQPYQHGYWYWTASGWTWQSHDPWGWVTDHYGYWRHHKNYGWVWAALPGMKWRPAVVTWFHTPNGVGWYPYWNGHAPAYVHTHAHGYDDGFWEGHRAGLHLNGTGYRWGWTFVASANFLNSNIFSVRAANLAIHPHYDHAFRNGCYGPELRDGRFADSRLFIESRMGRPAPIVAIQQNTFISRKGSAVTWVRPAQVSVPPYYSQVTVNARTRLQPGIRVSVGAVVRSDGSVIRPARPVILAPSVPVRGGGFQPMPPRSRMPATQPRQTLPPPMRVSPPIRIAPAPNPPRFIPGPSRQPNRSSQPSRRR